MENSEQNPEPRPTPMVNVWMVVLATMLATALFGFIWHTMGMSEVRAQDEQESRTVREDIGKLTAYRNQLKAKMASTSSVTTVSTPK